MLLSLLDIQKQSHDVQKGEWIWSSEVKGLALL